jgi:hypothetical protein
MKIMTECGNSKTYLKCNVKLYFGKEGQCAAHVTPLTTHDKVIEQWHKILWMIMRCYIGESWWCGRIFPYKNLGRSATKDTNDILNIFKLSVNK